MITLNNSSSDRQITVPANIVCIICDNLLDDRCPMYDPSRDVMMTCIAFCRLDLVPSVVPFAINARDTKSSEFPSHFHSHELSCFVCSHVRLRLPNNKYKRGNWTGPQVNGNYIRTSVMRAHGNDPVHWLSCWIRHRLPNHHDPLPPDWYLRMWLPMRSPPHINGLFPQWASDHLRRIIHSWRAVLEGPILDTNVLIKLVRGSWQCVSPSYQFMDDVIDAGGSNAACKQHIAHAFRNIPPMEDAFSQLGDDVVFCSGAVHRASLLAKSKWIPRRLMDDCVKHVCGGTSLSESLSVFQTAMEAAYEMAEFHKIDPAVVTHAASFFDIPSLFRCIETELSALKIRSKYEWYNLEVVLDGTYVENARDLDNNLTLSDIGKFHETMYPYERYHKLFQPHPRDLREMIERYAELRDILEERGLDELGKSRVFEDSRCAKYVLEGCSEDEADDIVDALEDTHFLCKHTKYNEYMEVMEDLESAELMALYEYVVNSGNTPDKLSPRLRNLFHESIEYMHDLWEDYHCD